MWLGTQTYENDIAQTGTCSICGVVFKAWGHNAAPVTDGRCCDECNATVVIPKRIQFWTPEMILLRKEWVAKTVREVVRKSVARMQAQEPR